MEKSKDLAIIILAAGTSSRLGNITKQLLKYREETFLKITVKKALALTSDVFMILGYEKEACKKELENFNINILFNKDYEKGIGSSISFGIEHTQNYKNSLIILCDQPFVPIEHLQSLKNAMNNKTIIATQYENSKSSIVPAIFPKIYYERLLKLKEDYGAKSILKNEKCISISLEKKYSIDIDTVEDMKSGITQ
jgi:molybdenum cofactor cytidylyltransferase|tara:strand:- start:2410 stop:2994 length:585 start_codon:yes stop_codon:yes gene_type:complete